MKRLIASISFLCYFAVSTGIVVNSHYCMKKLASVHLFGSSADKCGICGMDTHAYKKNGCCRDEVKFFKLAQDQNKFTITSYDIPAFEPLFITPSGFLVTAIKNIDEQRHFHNHSPPLLSAQDTYLQNNVFRI